MPYNVAEAFVNRQTEPKRKKRAAMDIVGTRRFVEVSGDNCVELPPLLVHAHTAIKRMDRVMGMAERFVENELMVAPQLPPDHAMEMEIDRRRMDLAIQLSERYLGMKHQWQWGDDVLEWIRQCETTFEATPRLRSLLRPDVWPHASRTSFVRLLEDKSVSKDVNLENAVGLRLSFRHLPPFSCCTDQFLFYLNQRVAESAYQAWSNMGTPDAASLPPERFHFDVLTM